YYFKGVPADSTLYIFSTFSSLLARFSVSIISILNYTLHLLKNTPTNNSLIIERSIIKSTNTNKSIMLTFRNSNRMWDRISIKKLFKIIALNSNKIELVSINTAYPNLTTIRKIDSHMVKKLELIALRGS
ncbi:hypothetical protein DPV78_012716, partial [Talaromyces pinophilus]